MLTAQLAISLLFSLSWTAAMSADDSQPDESFTRAKGSLTSSGLHTGDVVWTRDENLPDTELLNTLRQSGLSHHRRWAPEVMQKLFHQPLFKRVVQNTDLTLPGELDKKSAPYVNSIEQNRGGGVLGRGRRGANTAKSFRRDLGRTWKRAAGLLQGHSFMDIVKRDTSLITTNCGALGSRCRHIVDNTCVRMCVDGYMKTVCRTQRHGIWGCYIGPVINREA